MVVQIREWSTEATAWTAYIFKLDLSSSFSLSNITFLALSLRASSAACFACSARILALLMRFSTSEVRSVRVLLRFSRERAADALLRSLLLSNMTLLSASVILRERAAVVPLRSNSSAERSGAERGNEVGGFLDLVMSGFAVDLADLLEIGRGFWEGNGLIGGRTCAYASSDSTEQREGWSGGEEGVGWRSKKTASSLTGVLRFEVSLGKGAKGEVVEKVV